MTQDELDLELGRALRKLPKMKVLARIETGWIVGDLTTKGPYPIIFPTLEGAIDNAKF